MKVGLIVAPIILIALVVNLTVKKQGEEQTVVVKVDPNARINELVKQVDSLQKDYKSWRTLMQKEDPAARSKQEALMERLQKWRDEWDAIFDPQRDANNKLPAELQGWSQHRSRINELLEDVNKSSGI